MSFWLSLALQSAPSDVGVGTFDLARTPRPVTILNPPDCGGGGDEIVVCGRRKDSYRLPLPAERDPPPGPDRADAGSGAAALMPSSRCGIFAGERLCGKREAAAYGYGGGRDPITVLTTLTKKVVDPDGD